MSKKKEENQTEEQIKHLEEKVASLEDQLKRAVADYRNLERRVSEGRSELSGWACGELVKKILPVLDSLDQAVEGASESEAQSGWLKGVMMSIKQLRQVLSEESLVEIEAEGNFNPSLHEAVDVRSGEDGKILQIVLRGYTLNGKVLRPAKVVVGKSQPEEINKESKQEVESEEVK